MNDPRHIHVLVYLTPLEAQALAQLAKRITWEELSRMGFTSEESMFMRRGADQLAFALADSGYAPR